MFGRDCLIQQPYVEMIEALLTCHLFLARAYCTIHVSLAVAAHGIMFMEYIDGRPPRSSVLCAGGCWRGERVSSPHSVADSCFNTPRPTPSILLSLSFPSAAADLASRRHLDFFFRGNCFGDH